MQACPRRRLCLICRLSYGVPPSYIILEERPIRMCFVGRLCLSRKRSALKRTCRQMYPECTDAFGKNVDRPGNAVDAVITDPKFLSPSHCLTQLSLRNPAFETRHLVTFHNISCTSLAGRCIGVSRDSGWWQLGEVLQYVCHARSQTAVRVCDSILDAVREKDRTCVLLAAAIPAAARYDIFCRWLYPVAKPCQVEFMRSSY